jgi:hypothetical protein
MSKVIVIRVFPKSRFVILGLALTMLVVRCRIIVVVLWCAELVMMVRVVIRLIMSVVIRVIAVRVLVSKYAVNQSSAMA